MLVSFVSIYLKAKHFRGFWQNVVSFAILRMPLRSKNHILWTLSLQSTVITITLIVYKFSWLVWFSMFVEPLLIHGYSVQNTWKSLVKRTKLKIYKTLKGKKKNFPKIVKFCILKFRGATNYWKNLVRLTWDKV